MRALTLNSTVLNALIGAVLLVAACSSGAGTGGGGGGGGIVSGSPCNSATQQELCSGVLRMACVSGIWQATEVCPAGQMCLAHVGATPGTLVTVCTPIYDAGSTDSQGQGGNDALVSDSVSGDTAMGDGVQAQDIAGKFDVTLLEVNTGCTSASDCDDGLPCTIDACPANGVCSHKPQNVLCDDDDPCTQDLCQTGSGCSHANAPGGCDDGDACTTGDKCAGGQCSGMDKDCDDGDDCTNDSCTSGLCKHAPVSGCGASSMATATLLTVGKQVTGTLDPTGKVAWYKFVGKKGQLVLVALSTSQAQAGNAFDPTIIDTTLSLYGPDQKAYAFNDDSGGDNDSTLWTVLPADGTYYAKVEECWTFIAESPGTGSTCGGEADKADTDYVIFFNVANSSTDKSVILDKELGDGAANPTPMTFQKTPDGKGYYQDIVYGMFKSISDIDVFLVTLPLDTAVKQGRATLYVTGTDGGVEGNGSSSDPGIAWVTTQAKPTTILAQVDLSTGDLTMPVTLGEAYLLFVQHPPGAAAAHDFYVLMQSAAGSNPVEKSEAGNDLLTGAETLTPTKQDGSTIYFVAGDLVNNAQDVDHFTVSVPSGTSTVAAYCGAAVMGSGLHDLQVDILKADGKALAGGSGKETGTQLALKDVAVPAGTTKLTMRVSAGSQDAKVTGAYYECAFVFKQ